MRRFDDFHPYTLQIMHLHALQFAGYPFGKNDLTVEEWLDLARYKEVIEECRMKT